MLEPEKKVLDLGCIREPLLIFGGTYSNLQATQAIQEMATRHNIPKERCICTGDIVAYCGQPNETVSLIREWGVHCLLGNCEASFATNSEDCGCGFDDGSQCDLLSNQWFAFANSCLSQDDRQWFSALPHHIRFRINHLSALVVHGSASSINQFIFSSCEEDIFANEFSLAKSELVIGGHSGIPFSKIINNKIWHNSGAVGMPANDGTPRTWYSIISPYKETIKIEHKALFYEYQKTNEKMQESGLYSGYADCLSSGIWPSNDVLPSKERKSMGVKIEEKTYNI